MHHILVLGNGHIGNLIALALHQSGDYQVICADKCKPQSKTPFAQIQMDVNNSDDWQKLYQKYPIQSMVSALPFFCNQTIIDQACAHQTHYFDLTESEIITNYAKKQSLSQETCFMPQCGIAPGLINIMAYAMLERITNPTDLEIRVGAIPHKPDPNSELKYAHTWSIEGVIEEYSQPCTVIKQGKVTKRPALEDYETIEVLNKNYEAFNTSGGIGSLCQHLPKSLQSCNYKTIRHIGHHQAIKLLMQELNLQKRPDVMAKVLRENLPETTNDEVICHINVVKKRANDHQSHSWSKTFMPQTIGGKKYSAIEATTALSACAMIDIILKNTDLYQGFIQHHQIQLQQVMHNQFGKQLL